MKTNSKIFGTLIAVVLVGLAVWQYWPEKPQPPAPVRAVVRAVPAPVPVIPKPVAVPAPVVIKENPSETLATERMYAAHASLRAPEVADPDSTTNRQVLQTMVLKAFAQTAPVSPARP